MRTLKVVVLFVGLFLFVSPVFAQSSTTQAQIDALLAQIRVLQERLAQMQGSMSLKGCVDLSYNLYSDRTDAQTAGEVSKLQKFLAQTPHIYPSGLITGYFGPATEVAVQKWQAAAGIVSSGSPETTGYGYVGPKTRSLMSCGSPMPQTTPPVVTTPPIVSESCTITASKTSVGVGESYTISWTTRNIDDPVMYEEVKAGGTVEVNKRGSKEFTTSYVGTDTYQIGAGGLSAPYRPLCSVSVTASNSVNPPTPVITLDADRRSVYSGQSIKLRWNVKNAQRCVLQYGQVEEDISTSGSRTITPTETTSYRVWCANDPGTGKDGPSAEKSVKVTYTYPQKYFASEKISLNTYSLSPYANSQIAYGGSVEDDVDEVEVVFVEIAYGGSLSWNAVGNLLKDGSEYTAVSNRTRVSDSDQWLTSFSLPEGFYWFLIYDTSTGELLGEGVVESSYKG